MKKLLLVAALGVAGLVGAKDTVVSEVGVDELTPPTTCVAVESDCGEYGFACGERNSDGELDHEVIDEVRQLLNEAFCGYGD